MKTVPYYLMRHAAYYDHENQFVSYYGMLKLKHSMDSLKTELGEKFPDKKLRIIHSVLPRAKHTALLMEEMLSDYISILKRSDSRLNSDKLLIDQNYVQEVVLECQKENKICLILSHQPDIEHFCRQKLETAQYLCMDIEIDEQPVPKTSETDDLPF